MYDKKNRLEQHQSQRTHQNPYLRRIGRHRERLPSFYILIFPIQRQYYLRIENRTGETVWFSK